MDGPRSGPSLHEFISTNAQPRSFFLNGRLSLSARRIARFFLHPARQREALKPFNNLSKFLHLLLATYRGCFKLPKIFFIFNFHKFLMHFRVRNGEDATAPEIEGLLLPLPNMNDERKMVGRTPRLLSRSKTNKTVLDNHSLMLRFSPFSHAILHHRKAML